MSPRLRSAVGLFMVGASLLLAAPALSMPAGKGASPGHDGYGQPLPSPELPQGVITVLVIGQDMSEKRVDLEVRLVALAAGAEARTLRTGKDGRVRFDNLRTGQRYRVELPKGAAAARSADFEMPAVGGLRFLLSSGKAATSRPAHGAASRAAAAGAPALPPTQDRSKLSLGRGTHLLGELHEKTIAFMQVLELLNRGAAPVDASGLAMGVPLGAMHLRVDEGSPLAVTKDKQGLRFVKPIAVGKTTVRVSFQLALSGGRVDYRQELPLPLGPSLFALTNFETATAHGPSYRAREMRSGTPVFLLSPVEVGTSLELTIGNLPYHDPLPRDLALAGAGLLLVWMLATALGAGPRRREREARREALMTELTALAGRLADGKVKQRRYEERRRQVVAELRKHWDD